MSGKKVVGVDPNMWNLLYMAEEGDASSKDGENRMWYTHGTRFHEMKNDKLDKLEEVKETMHAGEKKVAEWERETQGKNSRLVFFEGFKVYCQSPIRAFEAVGDVQRTCMMIKMNRGMMARLSEDYNAARNIARVDLNNEERQSCLCMRRGSSPLDDVV